MTQGAAQDHQNADYARRQAQYREDDLRSEVAYWRERFLLALDYFYGSDEARKRECETNLDRIQKGINS